MAKFREAVLPQRPYLTRREEVTPAAADQPPVEQAPLVRDLPLLQNDLVHGGTVILVVKVELPTPAPGYVARKRDDAVIRSLQVVKPGWYVVGAVLRLIMSG